jgi:hypothetical protein
MLPVPVPSTNKSYPDRDCKETFNDTGKGKFDNNINQTIQTSRLLAIFHKRYPPFS